MMTIDTAHTILAGFGLGLMFGGAVLAWGVGYGLLLVGGIVLSGVIYARTR